MRVVKVRDNQNLGLSNKVKRQYKDRESIKDNTLFSFSNIYDCYKYIKDNIPGFADLFYSEKYDFNLSRTFKIIAIVCRANSNLGIAIVQDPCEENDRLYISSGNNENQLFKYMSKHCPESVIENTSIPNAAKYYYGNAEDDYHSISSNLLDVVIRYLKKVSSRKYPEYLRTPETMFSGVLETNQESYPDMQLIKHKVNESSDLGLNSKVKKKFDKVDAVDNLSQIPFEDQEVERICHEHDVYTIGDAIKVPTIKKWFSNNDKIKTFNELKFFTGLNSIEEQAFSYCTSLQAITIPSSVFSIEYRAFANCTSLQAASIPNGVTIIGPASFIKCVSLQSVTIPSSVCSIGESAFLGCEALQSVNIPNSVTSIGEGAFLGCEALQSVNIPNNSVTSIEEYTFFRCKSLQTFTIPNSVTSIGNNTFLDCSSLKSIAIPDSVTIIGNDAFQHCSGLKKVYMSSSCKAFDRIMSEIRKNSKDVTIIDPNSQKDRLDVNVIRENKETNITNSQGQDVPEIGKHAENVYLPDCPFMIGKEQVDWFEYFQREKEKHTIKDVDDFIQSAKKETKLIKESYNKKVNALEWFMALQESTSLGMASKVKKMFDKVDAIDNVSQIQFVDPEVERICHNHGVYTVDDAAKVSSIKGWFTKKENIKSFNELKFFTGLKTIESFSYCTSLQSVIIPDSVTRIGAASFYNCTSLQSITIPNSVTSIELCAFSNCKSLKSVTISNNVTTIEEDAFLRCGKLKVIYISKNCPVYNQIRITYPNIQLIEPEVKESSKLGLNSKVKKTYETTRGQDIDIKQLADFIRQKVYVAAGYSPDEDPEKVDYNLRVYAMGNCLVVDGIRICDEEGFYYAIDNINSDIEREETNIRVFKHIYIPIYKESRDKSLEAAALKAIEKSNRQVSGLTAAKNELEDIGWFVLLRAMTNSREPLILCT